MTHRFVLVPAAEVRADEPRIWCESPDIAAAEYVTEHGTLNPEFWRSEIRDWDLLYYLREPNTVGYPFAIVRRPRVDTQPLNPPPRYVVKRAEEMRIGEPGVMFGGRHHTREVVEDGCARYNQHNFDSSRCIGYKPWDGWVGHTKNVPVQFAIVDTHDDWHRTHASPTTPTPAPAPARTSTPTDREIVELHAWIVRGPVESDEHDKMPDGWVYEAGAPDWRDLVYSLRGHMVTRKDREAAWSRLLRARLAVSAEAERRRVLGPIDDPEEA